MMGARARDHRSAWRLLPGRVPVLRAAAPRRAGEAVPRRAERPPDPDLVVRVVAARHPARSEPIRDARGLGTGRRQPRLGEHDPADRAPRGAAHVDDRRDRRVQRRGGAAAGGVVVDRVPPLPARDAPPVALLVLRRVEGTLSPRAFVLWLGLVLGVQLYLALEVGFTLTVALACALVLAYLFVPDERRRLARSVPAIAAAYAVAAVVASPILYYALTDLRKTGFQPPEHFVADLANVVVPTRVEAAGAGWTRSIVAHFPANNTERGAYLGVALLVLLCLYVWQQRRRAGTRFLAAALLLALYASLGPHLTVAGHELIPLPTVFGHEALTLPGIGKTHLALFNNILPIRFTVYFALAAAVIAAIWTARAPAGAAMALGGLSVLLLVPNPVAWRTTYSIPAFFTNARYRPCIPVGANVLPQPIGSGGDAMLWQVERAFRFRMAGGRLQTSPPSPFHHPQATAQIGVGYLPVRNQPQLLRAYARRFGVSFAIVDERQARTWAPALDRIAQRHELGGVLLYPIGRSLPAGCPSA